MNIADVSKKRKVLLLIGVGLGTLLAALDATVVMTAMPKIVAELKGLEQYTWPLVSYLLCITIAMPLIGKLTDIVGSKPIYLFGVVAFLIGSALCGLAHNMLFLTLYRGIQGIGGAILISNALVIIGLLFAPAERAKYVGIVGSASALATIAGPALGGYITDSFGWQWVFFINLPIGLLALVVIALVFPKGHSSSDKKELDWKGSMFRVSVFRHAIAGMFLVNAALMGANIYIPLLVQEVLGASVSASGAIMTPMMAGLILGTITSGIIVSKTGRYKIQTIIGLGLSVAGFLLLSMQGASPVYWQIIAAMVIVGFGIGVVTPIFTTSAQSAFDESELGVVTSGVQFSKYLGSTIGPAVFGTVMVACLGNAENAAALATAIQTVLIICTAITTLSFIIAFFMKEIVLAKKKL